MNLRTIFTIYAVVSLFFGLGFIFMPETVLSLYDVTISPAGALVARLFGAALLGLTVLTWFARNFGDSEARKAIILALFIAETAGFIVALMGQLSGLVNPLGWGTVVLYLYFALSFGYFQFIKPGAS